MERVQPEGDANLWALLNFSAETPDNRDASVMPRSQHRRF
jgi:hypothetical protein